MPVKVLSFGSNVNILRLQTFLKGDQPPTEDDIQVDNVKVQGRPFLLFTIKELTLVSSQAAGVGAMIYFLGDEPIHEARNRLLEMLGEAKELDGVPLVIALDSAGRTVNIKQVISELELFKIKDRASMVKQIDFKTPASIHEMFDWAETQAQTSRGSQLFDAQPRVVKAKPKYREDTRPNEKTYEQLMQDKKFKGLSSVDQQQKYLGLERERIKENSMQTQLANFNRNKKKMTPYDIKPSPNPRIEPNLNFFLKDSQNEKPQEVNIKIQTDEFKEKPKSPRYVPKKTGVDSSTQVEDNELFDFDREVEPILNVLVTKTLELSSLEIEQEQQLLKMSKYKDLYNEKRKKEKQHHREQLKAEEQRIAAKDELLKRHRQKQTAMLDCFRKVQAYHISGRFLSRLQHDVSEELYSHGTFPNTFENELHTNYVDFLMKNTLTSLDNIHKRNSDIDGMFDEGIVSKLMAESRAPRQKIQQLKAEAEKRRVNYSHDKRALAIYYEHKPSFISHFARLLGKFCDKSLDQYNRAQSEKLKDLQAKLAQGEITEDVVTKAKADDLAELTKSQRGMLVSGVDSLAFTISHNEFERTPEKARKLQLYLLAVSKSGDVLESHVVNEHTKSHYFQFDGRLRDPLKPINMDEGVILDLNSVRDEVATILLGIRLPDVAALAKPENQAALKYSSYGLEYYSSSLPIDKVPLAGVKPEELVQAPENPDEPNQPVQAAFIFSYTISFRPQFGGWYLQTLNCSAKGKTQQQEEAFINDLVSFLKGCHQLDKEELGEDDEEPEKPKSSSRRSREDIRTDRKKKTSKSPEPQPPKRVIMSSRILPAHTIELNNPDVLTDLTAQVQSLFPDFIQSAQFGWELHFRGKPLESATVLKRCRKVGDITIERKAQVIIEPSGDEKIGEDDGSHKQEDEVKDD